MLTIGDYRSVGLPPDPMVKSVDPAIPCNNYLQSFRDIYSGRLRLKFLEVDPLCRL